MKQHRVDLELVLPSDVAACDACVTRLLDALRDHRGITKAHVEAAHASTPKLCLHYDPTVVRLDEVEGVVERAGASLRGRFEHLSEPVSGLRHERQAKVVEELIKRQAGVLHATVSFGSRRLYAEINPSVTSRAAVLDAAASAGIAVRASLTPAATAPDTHEEHEHDHGGPFGERTELVFSVGCGALTGIGWAVGKADGPAAISTSLFVAAYLLGSWFTVKEVSVALRARRFEIDFLMLVAAVGAAVLGEWLEGALLLSLFTLGHALEGYAMGRARKAIEALSTLVPAVALRVDGAGNHREVPVTELLVGDRVLVKPNTRFPADGFVTEGASTVNQAPITGESVPVEKRAVTDASSAASNPERVPAENRVFAGTINGTASLMIAVTKAAVDSTLARVVQMVSAAETRKSPTQQFTDRFERVFVPVIIALVSLLMFAGFVIDEPFTRTLYRAMAVLVAASPCALAIATPSAVLSGVARAARAGVLIKGGSHLESLSLVAAIAFDKTGTLTEGKPRLTDTMAMAGVSETELLAVAAAVEKHSDHPLASAIVEGAAASLASDHPRVEATGVEAIVGFGVRASVADSAVLIGKPGLFTREGALPQAVAAAVEALQSDGRTVMVVKSADRFLGVLGVMDTPRKSSREVVEKLHGLGIKQTIVLSGDNQRVADVVAKLVGIRTARGDLLPEQKVSAIAELARSAGGVAMVGDGVNDAPALATATVGIAMGAGGSDVALEAADVALMADDLRALPFAVGLSRAARRIIQQNLWVSLGMVAVLVPSTIFGFASMGVAVALHEGSTLLVVANALRLLAYPDRSAQ
jgi:Cd2+/Zn2+-exporting ATPase